MKFVTSCIVLLFCVAMGVAVAQSDIPRPKFVPPDIAAVGEEGHYQDLALIETNCRSDADARELWRALIERGALISVISSPTRFMGWVPQQALAAVRSTQLQTATGSVAVVSVSYTANEFRALRSSRTSPLTAETEADDAVLAFLDHIKRPRSAEEQRRIEDRALELEYLQTVMPTQPCNIVQQVEMSTSGKGGSTLGGPGANILLATKLQGIVANSAFFVESQTGTGYANWNMTIYDRYRILYVGALNYWTLFASKYGKTCTFSFHLYGPTSSQCQVSGEPIRIKEDMFVPTVVQNTHTITPETWGNIGRASRYCRPFNEWQRSHYSADYAVCGFIAYRATPSAGAPDTTGIWPHACSIIWGNGDHEGVYFAMDTQYWQAGDDPAAAPMRNVCAHEMGHLWGCPDEYDDSPGCYTWSYRGANNYNCQRNQTALGRPGLTMTGWDGIMGWNSVVGNSIATPVHVGVRTAAQMSPIRCFATVPANIPYTVKNCDNYTNRTYYSTMCVPMDGDYCMKSWVPASHTLSGTKYYFDHWEVTKKTGGMTTYDDYANELPSNAYYSTIANPVTDVKAVFTSTPPDFLTANTTLSAWLAPLGSGASPNRAIGLKWRNKYDMSKVVTKIEWERTAGNWVELTSEHMILGIFSVNIGQWTGCYIHQLPGTSGPVSINAGQLYRFRIVGFFNTNRGTNSNIAEVTTRPTSPASGQFCWDSFEPNSSITPWSLGSSVFGSRDTTISAACPISGWTGEFTWFTPKNDFYRLNVADVASIFQPGERVLVTLAVKPGSNFKPLLRAKRTGSSTYSNASQSATGEWVLGITTDGEYTISVEPQIFDYISHSFVDPTGGHFGFGEYTLTISRKSNLSILTCAVCRKVSVVPGAGLTIMTPHPPFTLFDKGLGLGTGFDFDMLFQPDPGWVFDGFDGDLGQSKSNPWKPPLGANTPPPGNYSIIPRVTRIPENQAELVLIYPDGPGGVFERRSTVAMGSTQSAVANPPSGYIFVGWGGDTSSTANPLSVVMWKSKKLVAHWRPVPCTPYQMSKWVHRLNVVNSQQGAVLLEYGMDPGATDSLESGQTGLPPMPPTGTFDVRWINIPGTNGSTTDIRPVQQSFIYKGTVQLGSTTYPARMTWGRPPDTANVSYMMTIVGESGAINMASTLEYTFAFEGRYQFSIEVKAKSCPKPPKKPGVTVTTHVVDRTGFPCIGVQLLVRDKATGEPRPYYNPYFLQILEKGKNGEDLPATISDLAQRDSVFYFRLCSNRDDDDPTRTIVVINDPNDPDTDKDTTTINVPVPTPEGEGKLVRTVRQYSSEWELISLPLDVANSDAAYLFPDPTTNLYRFDIMGGTYEGASNLAFGTGYWLKTHVPSVVYYGYEKTSFTWDELSGVGEPYGYGWNLIGSVSKPVPVGGIVSTPAGGLISIFGFSPATGYTTPAAVEPGKGYWVRVQPGTKLSMTGSKIVGGNPNTVFSKVLENLDVRATMTFSTATGASQPLAIAASRPTEGQLDALQLPPLPPTGLFDVRTDSRTRHAFEGENIIRIQGTGAVTIAMPPTPGSGVRCMLFDDHGATLGSFDEQSGGTVAVDVHGTTTLRLRVMVTAAPPTDFVLGQNYPNPFTAETGTMMPVTLPEAQDARIVVTDLLGRTVRTLLLGAQAPGTRIVQWDGRSDTGEPVPAGTYLYRLDVGGRQMFKSLSIMK